MKLRQRATKFAYAGVEVGVFAADLFLPSREQRPRLLRRINDADPVAAFGATVASLGACGIALGAAMEVAGNDGLSAPLAAGGLLVAALGDFIYLNKD